MPRCPNCNYELVLLEHRRKYKCAKCGKLFKQNEIETKEFQEWNRRQRQEEKEKVEQELKQVKEKPKLTQEERKQRAKASIERWRENNKEKISLDKEEYYQKNRDKLIVQKREYRKSLSGQQRKLQNEKRNARRWQNIEDIKVNSRTEYWRRRQKQLALLQLENKLFKAYNIQLQRVSPTFALSEQLSR